METEMHRRILLLAATISLGIGLAGWHRSGSLAAPDSRGRAAFDKTRSDRSKPGQTDDSQRLGEQVETAARKAAENGSYACCIRPACSWCLLHRGQCTCALGVGSGRGACRECHGGWEAGQGRIPGRTKEDVRKMKTFGKDEGRGALAGAAGRTGPSPSAEKTSDALSTTAPDGPKLFAENNCLSCHKMEGKGGTTGPDLTHEARRHADIAWQIEHLKDPARVSPGSIMPSYAKLKPEELNALASYLILRK